MINYINPHRYKLGLSCDPEFANVVLLMPMIGANNSTTFTDVSYYGRTTTRNGDAKISTTQSKWGGSSGYFDGSGDKITTPYISNQMDWWTSNFTAEAWVYPINLSTWSYTDGFNYLPSLMGNFVTGVGYAWGFGPISDGRIMFYYWNGTNNRLYSSSTISINQWSHIALVISGTTISIYINGVLNVSAAISGTPQTTTTLTIGEYTGNSINGYVDDLRITKGVARYTSNFAVPTKAFAWVPCYGANLIPAFSTVPITDGNLSVVNINSPVTTTVILVDGNLSVVNINAPVTTTAPVAYGNLSINTINTPGTFTPVLIGG